MTDVAIVPLQSDVDVHAPFWQTGTPEADGVMVKV
jgi:hypothetical protein